MSGNNIVIGSDGVSKDKLTITFEKEQFKEFINSLISTPTEETLYLHGGFEVNKSTIKILSEKINYHIGTISEVLNTEFACSVYCSGGKKITFSNFDQFISSEIIGNSRVDILEITWSYLIGFNRGVSDRSYEKQIVSIWFVSGAVGEIRISIRSTELTWPPAVIAIITTEMNNHELEVNNFRPRPERPYLLLAKYFRSKSRNRGRYRVSYGFDNDERSSAIWYFLLFATISAWIAIIAFLLTELTKRQRTVVMSDTGILVDQDFSELVARQGLNEAVADLRIGDFLLYKGLAPYNSDYSTVEFLLSGLSSTAAVVGICAALLIAIYTYACFWHAVALDNYDRGRILMTFSNPLRRTEVSAMSAVGTSLIVGVIGGIFSTLFIMMF